MTESSPSLTRFGIGETVRTLRAFRNKLPKRADKGDLAKACDEIEGFCEQLVGDSQEEYVHLLEIGGDLRKGLECHGVTGVDLSDVANQIVTLFEDTSRSLSRLLCYDGEERSVGNLVDRIESHVHELQVMAGGDAERPWTLVELKKAWSDRDQMCRDLKGRLGSVLEKLETLTGMSTGDTEAFDKGFEFLESAVTIREDLQKLFPSEKAPVVAGSAIRALEIVRERCGSTIMPSNAIPEHLEELFKYCDGLARALLDPASAATPASTLDQATHELEYLKAQVKELGDEATRTHSAVENLARNVVPDYDPTRSLVTIFDSAESRFKELESQIAELGITIQQLRYRENQLIKIEELLASGPEGCGSESAIDKIQGFLQDLNESLELLRDYRAADMAGIKGAVVNVIRHIERAKEAFRRVVPEQAGHLDDMAGEVSSRYEQIQLASERISDLCRYFSEYLNFGWSDFTRGDDIERYIAILETELAAEHRPLRLGLSAVVLVWQRVLSEVEQRSGGGQLVGGLRLQAVKEGLESLVNSLEILPATDLWLRGLRPGFSRQWMHNLFRAELLLESFYLGNSDHQNLEDAIGLAAAILRSTMQRLGKGIEDVELLEPFPSRPPEGWAKPRYLADPSLRTLPEVNQRVRKLLETRDNFIVDVERFRLRGDSDQAGECRVVVVNPAEWRQAQTQEA